MKNQLLLLEDVDGLGRSGDVVTARAGYIRNFLVPKKLALIADRRTLKLQTRLKEERLKRAIVDRQESEELAKKIEGLVLSTEVKVDPDGNMYGSVSSIDIVRMMKEKGYEIERKNISLSQPIKKLGTHQIDLRLNEGVQAAISLEILPETGAILSRARLENSDKRSTSEDDED